MQDGDKHKVQMDDGGEEALPPSPLSLNLILVPFNSPPTRGCMLSRTPTHNQRRGRKTKRVCNYETVYTNTTY